MGEWEGGVCSLDGLKWRIMGISPCGALPGVKSDGMLLKWLHAAIEASMKLLHGANLDLRSVVGRSAAKSPYSG